VTIGPASAMLIPVSRVLVILFCALLVLAQGLAGERGTATTQSRCAQCACACCVDQSSPDPAPYPVTPASSASLKHFQLALPATAIFNLPAAGRAESILAGNAPSLNRDVLPLYQRNCAWLI